MKMGWGRKTLEEGSITFFTVSPKVPPVMNEAEPIMSNTNPGSMRVRLADERKADILRRLTSLYASEFDEKLSPFRAEQILTLFVQHLGPAVYNQAIQDARKYMTDRLEDLDATFYQEQPAEPANRRGRDRSPVSPQDSPWTTFT